MSVIEVVKKFLSDNKYIKPGDIIDTSESLLEQGFIDSVGVMTLVLFLEDVYKINVEEDDLVPENFESLKAIENYVKRKTA
jgi:acyl carrier protein